MGVTHVSLSAERGVGPRGRDPLWSVTFVGIIVVSFIGSLSNQALANVIPLYVDSAGGTALFSGVLVAVFAVSSSLTRLVGGMLADKKGRTLTLIVGITAFLVGVIGINLAGPLWLLPLWRVFQGAGFALVSTASATMAASVIPASRQGEGLGFYGLGQSLSMALGPSLGLILLGLSVNTVFLPIIGVLGVAMAIALFLRGRQDLAFVAPPRQERSDHSQRWWWSFIERSVLPVFWVQLITALAFSGYLNFLSLYGVSSGVGNPGIFFIFAAASTVLSRIGIARLIDRLPTRLTLTFIYALGVASFLVVYAATNSAVFYAAGALFGLSFGLSTPMMNTMAIRLSPRERWGAATATNYLGTDIGVGVGGIVAGAIVTQWGFGAFFACGAAVMALAYVVAMVVLGTRQPQ